MVSHIMKDAGRARATGLNPATCAMDIMVGNQNDGTNRLAGEHKVGEACNKIITA